MGILTLMESYGHISIDDLFEQIKKEFSSISLATLYKNIHSMMQVQLIKEIKIPQMKSRYEITKEAHAHLLCESCGSFEDIFLDVSALLKSAEQQSHYQLRDSSIVYCGLCPKCQS